jgi:outer membrane protein
MRSASRTIASVALAGIAWLSTDAAAQPVLTADDAVKMALQRNSQMINASADVLSARGGLYGAYAGVLPRVSAGLTRSGSRVDRASGSSLFGSFVTPSVTTDRESYSTSPQLSGSWQLLNLSSIAGLSSARAGLKVSKLAREATRAEVALATRQQFYQVVQAAKLIGVASQALTLARDSERRVRVLFEVGSVSRSDVLQAQVQTAQSQLDSIGARQALLVQRDLLAMQIGIEEARLGEVDTVLIFTPHEIDEAGLLGEAAANRPDLKAASLQLKAARAGLMSARLARLPYVTVAGSAGFDLSTAFRQKSYGTTRVYGPPHVHPDGTDSLPVFQDLVAEIPTPETSGNSKVHRQYGASISLNWDFFDGLATDSRNAAARAQLMRAQNAYDVLHRNLAGEVHEAALTYQQVLASEAVAEAAVASATENMKLTQQKYNVGSATILDLITAQVALARAQSQLVNALAAIRVAEARIDRVRGRGV